MKYPASLLKLIEQLKRLPGVGAKSAERFAFDLLEWSGDHLQGLAETLSGIKQQLQYCPACGCLMEQNCPFCIPSRATTEVICIISSAREAFSIEATHEFKGLYHVLGGLLSPLQGVGPNHLRIPQLKQRLAEGEFKEILIALDSTLEGDSTALYLKRELQGIPVKISRLAFGLPMGSSLSYVDGGTLARALAARSQF